MIHLATHKGQRIDELIEERARELVYLPPYSPDLNPIEEAFSKVKRLLRETEARVSQIVKADVGKVGGLKEGFEAPMEATAARGFATLRAE